MIDAFFTWLLDKKHRTSFYRSAVLILLLVLVAMGIAAPKVVPAYVQQTISENPTVAQTRGGLLTVTTTVAGHDVAIGQLSAALPKIWQGLNDIKEGQQKEAVEQASLRATTVEHGKQLQRIEDRLNTMPSK